MGEFWELKYLMSLRNSNTYANLTPTSTLNNTNWTSDEADDQIQHQHQHHHQHHHQYQSQQQQEESILNERKQRRMISNRESARRSRIRKQRHLDELWAQLVRLRSENRQLAERLCHVTRSHEVAVEENARLKDHSSHLRQMLAELIPDSNTLYSPLTNLEAYVTDDPHVPHDVSN